MSTTEVNEISKDEGLLLFGGRWLEPLVTTVNGLNYDFVTRIGRLDMPAGCCCDMNGCVALFQRIDPAVRRISTFTAGRRDTVYPRGDDGKWQAWLAGRRRS